MDRMPGFSLICVFALLFSVPSTAFTAPGMEDQEVLDKENSVISEERVDTVEPNNTEESDLKEEIEDRLDEKTRELERRNKQKISGAATSEKSGGFFSVIFSFF
ncbi:MAG: hypothetical protein V5A72_01095 [Candidatus Nanohaloarchaea archaeon]